METASLLLSNFIELTLDASPWLLLGLLIAGLMKAWLPPNLLSKHLGAGNFAIIKAALIGAPLPLCSCGVIPVATELRRSGASPEATSSFLVATPETGVDSITVSYAMLGPVFAIFRPISAILSAIATGFLVKTAKHTDTPNNITTTSCCAKKAPKVENETSCCSSAKQPKESFFDKTLSGIKYALTKLIDDLIKWLLVGLIFATLVKTFIPTSFLTEYGSGLVAMLIMIAISIPMYICATASTPVAAGFIMAGVSPGTALVFMMAGPATNISTLGVIKSEMGNAVLIRYLTGISACAIGFGMLLDSLVGYMGIDIAHHMQHSHELLPLWLTTFCALIIAFSAIKPLRIKLIK
ncbi:SO_0444 family Cu/Zn efflux transporter [Thalassotalea algicola]|uniref:SO_0444 family Cu/Zn efflux transporter n=1 Tax=Thalassotalea algicola TaxID=2716224 RepID=UPI002E2C8FD4|nr:SO_0444 family Cu/Zn efflux transporter [Thalassotalea algicola]